MIDLFNNTQIEVKFRDYQQKSVNNTISYMNTPDPKGQLKAGVAIAPVAAGKSFMIAGTALSIKTPLICLQPNKELLEQNHEKYILSGGSASIFSASLKTKEVGHVTYATLGSIKKHVNIFKGLGVKHIIVDECDSQYSANHGSMFRTFLEELQPTHLLGYTATPIKLTKGELKFINNQKPKIFNDVVDVIQVQDLYEKYWASIHYEVHPYNASGLVLKSNGMGYTEDSIWRVNAQNKVNNTVCNRIMSIRNTHKSILVFVDTVSNASVYKSWLKNKGITAEVVDGGMDTTKRTMVVDDFKKQKIQVVLCHSALLAGFDFPALDCMIFARPTNSFRVYYQALGRLVRPHPDGKECLYIDMCGTYDKFGPIEHVRVEEIPHAGWAMLSGRRVITNVPIDSKVDVVRYGTESICSKANHQRPGFGKYANTDFWNIPSDYIQYIQNGILSKSQTARVSHFENNFLKVSSKILAVRKAYDAHF